MIIKSKVRGNGGKLANYLLNDPKNDRAELLDLRGWTADYLKDALVLSEEIARGKTQCEKPFYHVSFRLAPGEELTPEQWQHCADALEKRVGLKDHHRAMVMHTYKGEKHLHVVWDRIDENTFKAAELSFEHLQCKKTARALEKELGLQQVRDEKREPEKELASPTREEEQQARRKGQDLKKLRAAIREAWEKSEDGKSFAEALDERGFTLAKGEKRDYVAIDEQGSVYSIGKRTTGATAREVRTKLADLAREQIPSVEQAREELPARIAERKEQREEQAREFEEKQREEKLAQAAIQKAEEEQKASNEQAKTDTKRQSRIKRSQRIETIRLYRGIGNNVGVAKEGEAIFFSTNKDRAAAFGVLHYVDVTRAEFEKLECPHSKRILDAEPIAKDDYRVDDPQILARLQRLKQRDSETRNQEREAAQRDYEAAQAEREQWEERIAQAAIQKAEEDQRKEREAKRDEAKNGELGQSAADIRLAATLSPSGESFSAALKERCLVLSQISKQEAAALTDELGHHAPHYNAGELVIMNQFGGIHRLTERTTGKTREELDKYLVQIKRENLPNAEHGKKEAVLLAQYKQRAELLAKQAQQKSELEKQHAERKEQREKQARELEEKARQEIDGAVSSKHYSDQFRLEKHLKENNIGLFGRAAARIKQFIGHKIEDHQAEQHKEKLHKTIIENDWRNQDRDEARQARQDKSHERGQATVEIKQAERRDELGIQAPERDEALKDAQKTAQRTNTEKGFKELAEQTTSEVMGGLPSERAQERLGEWKNKPAKPKDRDESALDKTMRAVGKGGEAAGQAGRATDKGLRVIDKATGAIGGLSNGIGSILDGIAKPVEAFAEGLANMLGGASPAPRIHRREPDPTPDQIREAELAITNINQSIKRGDDIDAADLRNLPKETLEDIREGGDEYLMKMCQNWEIQQREREKEKERER